MIISEKFIKYMGRFDFSNEGNVKLAWTHTSMKINFFGSKVSAELESDGNDYFLVVLDGEVYNNCFKVTKKNLYTLVDGIEKKSHTIELIKRTEAFVGTSTFYGFELFDGYILDKPQDNEFKIEIFGDSISCGYGNEAENENSGYDPINGNSYFSYGSIAARDLNADLNLTSWAGLGLVRNYDDSPNPLPERIDWITPSNVNIKWNFSNFKPNVVIINLGTNDFNEKPPTKEKFVEEYKKFINRIISYYGDIKIICAIGPVMDGESLEHIREYVKYGVVEYYNSNENKKIYFLEHEHQKERNGYGETYHPSRRTHEIMANEIINKIREI